MTLVGKAYTVPRRKYRAHVWISGMREAQPMNKLLHRSCLLNIGIKDLLLVGG